MSGKNRTDNEILAYIRHQSRSGELAKSLLEIAAEVGYSNATVHRVLKRLEAQDLVRITRNERKANEPSIITYIGPTENDQTAEEGIQLVAQLQSAAEALLNYLQNTDRSNRMVQEDARKWRDLQSRIESVTDLPQGLQLMTIRQEGTARHVV